MNKELGIRRSYLSEARRVAGEFLKRQLQLIVFCQSRLSTEILTTYLKDDFEGPPGTPEQVRGYRGGYLPLRRREIERGLREGLVRAVVATNALELGIDIGALDTVVMAGYPGTIASTWQDDDYVLYWLSSRIAKRPMAPASSRGPSHGSGWSTASSWSPALVRRARSPVR